MPAGRTGRQPDIMRRPAPPVQRQPVPKGIEIRLALPHLGDHPLVRRLAARTRRTSRKQRIITLLALVLVLSLGTYVSNRAQTAQTTTVAGGTQNPLDKLQKGTPNYETVLPAGKSIDKLGGWTRISPPEREPVYAYVDKIGSVAISVSQQPLPQSFKKDPDAKVEELALAQSADKTIQIGSAKAYIGTSSNGPQSVIYHTDTLLILLKSSAVIADDEWKKYIQSLS